MKASWTNYIYEGEETEREREREGEIDLTEESFLVFCFVLSIDFNFHLVLPPCGKP